MNRFSPYFDYFLIDETSIQIQGSVIGCREKKGTKYRVCVAEEAKIGKTLHCRLIRRSNVRGKLPSRLCILLVARRVLSGEGETGAKEELLA